MFSVGDRERRVSATPAGARLNASVEPDVYRRLLLPVYLPSLLTSVGLQAQLILLPLYVLELTGSAVLAAVLIGVRGAGMLVFDIPVGLLAARYGDKPVMLAGVGGLAVSGIAFAVVESTPALGMAAALSGMAFSAWMLGRHSYITDTCDLNERGRALAILGGIMRVGALIGPAAGALAAQRFGYEPVFLITGLAAFAGFVMVTVFTLNVRPRVATVPRLTGLAEIVRQCSGVFATAGLAGLTLQLMRAARQLLLPLFGYVLGLDVGTIGLIVSLSALIDVSLFYPVGVIMDRHGRKRVGVPCMVVFVIGLALLPLSQGFSSLLLLALLLGFANGLGSGLVLTLGSDFAPAERRAEFLGLWRLIGDVGFMGAPMLIAGMVQVFTLGAASLATAAVGLVGAYILIRHVPEPLQDP